ncbi:HAD-IA family hydrolase [Actinospica durhamensis]|uniref:HAD-IA family hydrolase n=1 Tax=Actinospica durhamensis TaxID=1508375 RepID=A0A941IRH0_9ACTN|nr:HAD-IA family hydrolase [Actinospica durhamensis]MBR7837344.1 HAD-IA family hydrolase [Actinospica durhamensis]
MLRTPDPAPSVPPKAVLLDSGGVLMQPIGGRWNPRADFERTVLSRDPQITAEQFAQAIALGDRFMATAESTPDLDKYHAVMLEHLGIPASADLLAELVRPVPADVVLEIFDEVIDTLKTLQARGVRMAVVSDAWPNLPQLHADLGIHEFFEAYAISAVLGCRKPDPRMYRHASDALGLTPADCLFVDDSPELVAAALDLGYQARWMDRTGTRSQHPDSAALAPISSLTELIELFPDAP